MNEILKFQFSTLPGKNFNKYFRQFLLFSGILLITYYVSMNWYQLLLIHGKSMEPAYHDMQLVVIDKHSHNYTYNDVIAFQCDNLDLVLVKRVAACPGDQVIIKNGRLYVNGNISAVFSKVLFEYAGIVDSVIQLENNHYFVIGDNVRKSKDSRYKEIGCICDGDILGKVISITKSVYQEENL